MVAGAVQAVVDALRGRFNFVQIGDAEDPPSIGGDRPAGQDELAPVGGGLKSVAGCLWAMSGC